VHQVVEVNVLLEIFIEFFISNPRFPRDFLVLFRHGQSLEFVN
jgi:hypothetical protein